MKFGIGVLGATGYIGTPYRKEIGHSPDDAQIVALCARRREPLEAAAREDGARFAASDWRQVVEHPDVNLVLVCTPDAFHYEAVMACAAAGKHVFCEKPVGMNAREAREMKTACTERRLGHFVPFWTRYVPIFRRAREVVRSGLLGEVRAVLYRWHNPRPAGMPFTWRDDVESSAAGSLADVGSHAYDTIRWLLGQEAVRVLAHAGVITPAKPDLGPINLEEALQRGSAPIADAGHSRRGTAFDYGDIAFEMESGAVGSLVLSHATYLRKGLAPEVELHGTEASLSIDRLSGRLMLVRPGGEPALFETCPDPGFGNRFAQHVFPALRDRSAGRPTDHPGLEDGWRVQLFTDACSRSAKEGTWITVGQAFQPDSNRLS
ncbi:MAG: Gfo/Idh/MocA family oxidoreductase [Planctomycetia bacterium]|nr:Gfo/Idh/MocA family oxidoreductase [Planctomycetia bacterium]